MNAREAQATREGWVYVGQHASRVDDAERSFTTVVHGVLSLEEYDRINALLHDALQEGRALFFVLDLTEMTRFAPDIRRRISGDVAPMLPEAMIIVGASAPIRLLATFFLRARTLLGLPTGRSFLFSSDLSEARAWIAERLADERPVA